MLFRLALIVCALLVCIHPAAAQTRQFGAPAGFAPLGDGLDQFCNTATSPRSIALCSDRELRALAVERQRVFDEARARVGDAGYSALLADQNAWVRSYSQACRISADVPPRLPLAPALQACMARAGQARIAYLRTYGIEPPLAPVPTAAAGERLGPGFDCTAAKSPMAQLICASPELSRTDLLFNQAYQALFYSLDADRRRQLQVEDVAFLNSVKAACGIPDTGAAAGSGNCLAARYNQKRSGWMARLSGPASEEARRPIERHVALQAELQRLGFLSPSANVDGSYGPATRAAIVAWQNARGRPATGFLSDADAAALGGGEPSGLIAGLSPPHPAATSAPSPPEERTEERPAAQAGPSEVALKQLGGTYRVPVRINDQITLNFTLDSGASDVLIPADVVLTLFRTETLRPSDFTGEKQYVLADGSKLPSARFVLRELKVGEHRLTSVMASIGPVESTPLLGQSFLSRFKAWTLDNDEHALILIDR